MKAFIVPIGIQDHTADKRCIQKVIYFYLGKHFVGTQQKCLFEALLMSTHNMFSWRNKKNIPTFWLKKEKKTSYF